MDRQRISGDRKKEDARDPVRLDSDIKMILNLAGNCLINQHSDINRTSEILKDTSRCEFILCSDLFMTASARFADILLPGVSMFECENITMPWQYGDFLGFNNKVIEPLYEGRFEYDWLCEVAQKIGLGQEFSQGRTAGQWLEYLYNRLKEEEGELPDYKEFKEAGIFRYQNHDAVIAFEKERKDPETFPFPTRSGKIEIFSEKVFRTEYKDFFPAIPRYVEPPEGAQDPLSEKYPIQLIGWHTRRRCHSIHDNNREMDKLDPQAVWMNPADAGARGLKDGDMALVWNDRGKMKIPVRVTDRIMAGVAAVSQGAWYRPDKDGTDTGGSINVLTSQRPTPYAKGNPQHTNLVEVKRVREKKPYIFAVSGYKNSGKTTLLAALIPELTCRGYKVAVIKHDGHDFESDVPGTDSYRLKKAGAYGTAVYSSKRLMVTKEYEGPDEKMLIEAFGEADIILIEGLKHSVYPKYVCNYPEQSPISPGELADRIERGMREGAQS